MLQDGEEGLERMNNQKSRLQEAEGRDILRRAEDVHQGSTEQGVPRDGAGGCKAFHQFLYQVTKIFSRSKINTETLTHLTRAN